MSRFCSTALVWSEIKGQLQTWLGKLISWQKKQQQTGSELDSVSARDVLVLGQGKVSCCDDDDNDLFFIIINNYCIKDEVLLGKDSTKNTNITQYRLVSLNQSIFCSQVLNEIHHVRDVSHYLCGKCFKYKCQTQSNCGKNNFIKSFQIQPEKKSKLEGEAKLELKRKKKV